GKEGERGGWAADGQINPSATITLQGTQPSYLELNGHKATLGRAVLSAAARIRTGKGGALRVKQLSVGGVRLKDGTYAAPLAWLEGTGNVIVDARVDVRGTIGSPDTQVGPGNIANLVGDSKFSYPANGCHVDVI